MRRTFVALLALCCCSPAVLGQKTRWGQDPPLARPGVDYPIKVHLSELHYRAEFFGGLTDYAIYADAIMNGKKIELRGESAVSSKAYKLALGDYQARLLKDPHKMGDTPLFQEYEVVLPDKTVWRCTVTGISE